MGLWHTMHSSTASTLECLAHILTPGSAAGSAAAGAAPVCKRIRGAATAGGGGGSGAGVGVAAGAADRAATTGVEIVVAPGGGGAISVAGATEGTAAAIPNCWRIKFVTYSEESRPHEGQTNLTGWCAWSGVTSKAYFAPQAHWIFMVVQGLSNTTPEGSASEKGVLGGDHSTRPSVNKKFPPDFP